MTITVHRYPLEVVDVQTITMPAGAEILHVARREGTADDVELWAKVDTDQPPADRRFRVAGTGHPLDGTDLTYLDSVQLAHGQVVFHVFELTD